MPLFNNISSFFQPTDSYILNATFHGMGWVLEHVRQGIINSLLAAAPQSLTYADLW
jgi:hypothetical protein